MQIVVLATGGGREASGALSLVRGRPLIDWQLDCFVASGARSVVLCVGVEGEQIETHVRRAVDRGLSVGYSYGGESLGSGGALRRALARLESDFVLTFADLYLPFDYAAPLLDLRAHPNASATLALTRGAGSVVLDGDTITSYGERAGELTSYGALALRRATLEDIADGAVWQLDALLRRLAARGKLRGFVAPEPGYRAGSAELERHLAAQRLEP